MKHFYESIGARDPGLIRRLENLESSIAAFSRFTSIPVTFFSPAFELQWEFNKTAKFCITNRSYENPCSKCRTSMAEAMAGASDAPEGSTFICATGLVNICCPFFCKGRLAGYFIAGPMAMGRDHNRVISEFYEKVQEESIDMPLLMTMTNNLNVYSPDDVDNLSKIFYDVLRAFKAPAEKQETEHEKAGDPQRYSPRPAIEYSGHSDVVFNALAYIHSHFRTISDLQEIADYVHVSRSYLSSLFKKETGVSVVDYFHTLRMDAALWALEHTDMNVTDIALSVGYRESSYFSRLFKERFDISPRDYRKKPRD